MQTAEKRLLKNTVFLYIMQISGYIFPLLTFPYLTRVLGPEKYGIIVFSNAVIAYFQMLVDFGFLLSATNICSINRDDKKKLAHITIGIIQSKIFLGLVGAVILFFCCMAIPDFQDKKAFLCLSYIGIILSIFLPDYLFRGIEQMSIITYRVLLSRFVYAGLVFLLVRTGDDYLYVPAALIGSNLTAVLLTWYEIIRKLRLPLVRVTVKETISYLRDSSVFFLSRIATSMYSSLNTVLLGFQFSSISIAQYGAANTLITSGRTLLSPIADSVYPYMVTRKNYRLVKKIILILEPCIAAVCVLLFILADKFIILVCGKEYIGATPVFRAMLPLVVITLPLFLFGYPVLGALGKINTANISVMIASVFHIAGLLALYFSGRLSFVSISLLTVMTDCIVLVIRSGCAMRELQKIKIYD